MTYEQFKEVKPSAFKRRCGVQKEVVWRKSKVFPSGIIHFRRERSLSMSWARNRLALVRES